MNINEMKKIVSAYHAKRDGLKTQIDEHKAKKRKLEKELNDEMSILSFLRIQAEGLRPRLDGADANIYCPECDVYSMESREHGWDDEEKRQVRDCACMVCGYIVNQDKAPMLWRVQNS